MVLLLPVTPAIVKGWPPNIENMKAAYRIPLARAAHDLVL